jgi:hypothetical protein
MIEAGADPGFFEVPDVNATDDNSDSARPEGPRRWGSWEEVITPSPSASDGTISCISYPSDLTVLLNSIIKNFQFFFHAGRSPQRPNSGSAPASRVELAAMRTKASSLIISLLFSRVKTKQI